MLIVTNDDFSIDKPWFYFLHTQKPDGVQKHLAPFSTGLETYINVVTKIWITNENGTPEM